MSTGEWDLFYPFKVHTHVQNKRHYQMLKGQIFCFRKAKIRLLQYISICFSSFVCSV